MHQYFHDYSFRLSMVIDTEGTQRVAYPQDIFIMKNYFF